MIYSTPYLVKIQFPRNVAETHNCMCHWYNFKYLTSNPDSPENLGQDDIQHSQFGQDPIFPKCGWNTIVAMSCATDEIDCRSRLSWKFKTGWYIALPIWSRSNFPEMWLKHKYSYSMCYWYNFKCLTMETCKYILKTRENTWKHV